jgi:hypothetical protein
MSILRLAGYTRGGKGGVFRIERLIDPGCGLCAALHRILDDALKLVVVARVLDHEPCHIVPIVEEVECTAYAVVQFALFHDSSLLERGRRLLGLVDLLPNPGRAAQP